MKGSEELVDNRGGKQLGGVKAAEVVPGLIVFWMVTAWIAIAIAIAALDLATSTGRGVLTTLALALLPMFPLFAGLLLMSNGEMRQIRKMAAGLWVRGARANYELLKKRT